MKTALTKKLLATGNLESAELTVSSATEGARGQHSTVKLSGKGTEG